MGGVPIPVFPPKRKSAAPYDVTPKERDPTSQGPEEKTKLQQIPERPVEPKPGPPQAPRVPKSASQGSENVKTAAIDTNQWFMRTMPERNVAPARVSIPETVATTPEGAIWLHEGNRVVGFGCFQEYTYREARGWMCEGR